MPAQPVLPPRIFSRLTSTTPEGDMSGFSRLIGQEPGTGTNDAANAGNIGEFISAHSTGSFTATITIAVPGVVSGTHNFRGVCAIVFTNSGGALPTGVTSGTTYFT